MVPARAVLAVLVIASCFVTASLSATEYGNILRSDSLISEMAAMFEEAESGPQGIEVAAFLVRTDSGLDLVRWKSSAKNREQVFHGTLPAGTVAIVHTHPNGWERPSAGDRAEAKRVGLPIYVLTRRNIWVAAPDSGRSIHLVNNVDWRKPSVLLASAE